MIGSRMGGWWRKWSCPVDGPPGNSFPSISNLVTRWKASTVTGLSDGDLLTASIADLSSAANDGTISASGVRWYATVAGGKPSFGQTSAAAAGKILATNNTSLTNVTLFMVNKYVANQTGGATGYNAVFGKEGAYATYINNSSGAISFTDNSTVIDRGTGYTDTGAFHRIIIRMASGVADGSDIWVDGAKVGTSFTLSVRDQLSKLSMFDIAGYHNASYIPEAGLFDKLLSDAEMAQVDVYLLAEYGT